MCCVCHDSFELVALCLCFKFLCGTCLEEKLLDPRKGASSALSTLPGRSPEQVCPGASHWRRWGAPATRGLADARYPESDVLPG